MNAVIIRDGKRCIWCAQCAGSGTVPLKPTIWNGQYDLVRVGRCPACDGKGVVELP